MIRRPGHGGARDVLPAAVVTVIMLVTVSPWALGFSASHAAVAEHIAFAMGFGPIAVLISALPAAAISIGLAGGWLVASPWALGYASVGVGAWSADLVGGVILVALGAAAWRASGASRPVDAPVTMNGSRP
jgi:SPW repeat-containing protein